MFCPTPQHQKLPDGSIDYGFYDKKARELRSADLFALFRSVSSIFGNLCRNVSPVECQLSTYAQSGTDVSQSHSTDLQSIPVSRLADMKQPGVPMKTSRKSAA
ncbi:hypothetical protein LP7551_00084 [Roseibium album]|nr:hypothetical protein LP7551_00084 [Roseibium album]